MPLLDDNLRSRLPPLFSQEADSDPMVFARFFLPETEWAWYVLEGQPFQGDDFMFFGFDGGRNNEFGYFLLSELEALRSPAGAGVERDQTFIEGRLTDVVPAPET